MISFHPAEKHRRELHQILLSCVAPRPIAFVSTVDKDGIPNLAAFSFFNCFSSNPPVVVFSPSYRGTDGSEKDTLRNLKQVPECTINGVTEAMLPQVNLAAAPFPPDIDEFQLTALTPVPSTYVQPCRVGESPYSFECKVRQILPLAEGQPGSGNLVICDILYIHLDEKIFSDSGKIDPRLLQPVSRMGYSWYLRTTHDGLFELPMPSSPCVGIPNLPDYIRNSPVFTNRDLALLATVPEIPKEDPEFIKKLAAIPPSDSEKLEVILYRGDLLSAIQTVLHSHLSPLKKALWLHRLSREYLQLYHIDTAWQVLLLPESKQSIKWHE